MFLTFVALSLLLILVLPVVVGVVAGDSIAGEAGYGTLRYLLAVPAGPHPAAGGQVRDDRRVGGRRDVRRLGDRAWSSAWRCSAPARCTLLSGTTVSLADGLVHVLWVTLYVCAAMAAFGAIALAISTFTEHSIGAIAAALIIVVASEVVDNIPQFAPVAPYIPTHWWLSFDSLLRTPIDTTTLSHGLLSFAVYAVLFLFDRLGPLHLGGRHQLSPLAGHVPTYRKISRTMTRRTRISIGITVIQGTRSGTAGLAVPVPVSVPARGPAAAGPGHRTPPSAEP